MTVVSFIRPAIPGDMWLMLPDVRQPDIDELAALGATPEDCIRYGMRHSDALICFIHGQPAAIYGAVEHEDHAVPWAVLSTIVDKHPLPFLRASRAFIDSIHQPMCNYVDARNEKTVEWLRWLGFAIEEPEPLGIHDELFRKFWKQGRAH